MPSLVLIDGGLGQLHAAAQALEALEIINQPLAAIAKREEIIYVHGQEDDPVVLDHHSPVLHLVQMIRDEAHRFAVTFHRKRRQIRDRATELREIPGVGESTTRRLLEHFGSLQAVKQADVAALSAVVTKSQAEAILEHFRKTDYLAISCQRPCHPERSEGPMDLTAGCPPKKRTGGTRPPVHDSVLTSTLLVEVDQVRVAACGRQGDDLRGGDDIEDLLFDAAVAHDHSSAG